MRSLGAHGRARLGRLLGLAGEELREIYYHSLLRFIGCNAEAYALAALFGDAEAPQA